MEEDSIGFMSATSILSQANDEVERFFKEEVVPEVKSGGVEQSLSTSDSWRHLLMKMKEHFFQRIMQDQLFTWTEP